ncbi:hypothetical protein ACJ41O_011690 [Fusarium nematophilum]
MPPRITALPRLGSLNLCLRPKPATPNFLPLVQTANLSQREKKRKAKQDPYRWAQAQQRKSANVQRREELRRERDEAWGDPIKGQTTPFVESLDSAGQDASSSSSQVTVDAATGEATPQKLPTSPELRNYFLSESELQEAVKHAYTLTKPVIGMVESQIEPGTEEDKLKQHEQRHNKAVEALKRITALSNGSAKDRRHANVRRIVDEFGRHNTDQVLKPKAQSIHPNPVNMPSRSGPDTGSSEVQIAILTAKIRSVSQALQINRGYKDKHNRRNLRLLLHRRQKLLKYMDRKERGSERWTHMIEKLGLTPATWNGQIEL